MPAPIPNTPTEKPKLTRRTLLVEKGFQVRYTLLLSLVGAVSAGVFGLLVLFVSRDARQALSLPAPLESALASTDVTLVWLIVALTVLMAGAMAVFGLLLTHRVAGPVYVMNQYLAVLAKGRYPQMRPLRRHDELKRHFESFRSALESMREREAKEAELLERAIAAFTPFAGASDAQQLVDELKATRDRKREAVDPKGLARGQAGKSAA